MHVTSLSQSECVIQSAYLHYSKTCLLLNKLPGRCVILFVQYTKDKLLSWLHRQRPSVPLDGGTGRQHRVRHEAFTI